MKKLGFGLMRLPLTDPNDPSTIDTKQLENMVDTFIEKGFTYFDTAWMYHNGKSENAVKTALVDRHPRESFTLATKLHGGYVNSFEDRDRIFNTQLEKTGAEYFDYYLLHALCVELYEKYQKYDCFEWLREKKRQGIVKKIGFSFHDTAELLDRVLTEQPGMDFVQLQINYLDWESDGIQSRLCCEVAQKHGVPVIVMEPVKGGTLAQVPQSVENLFKSANAAASIPSWALRFAGSPDNVFMVLSGMSNMEQLLDNIKTFDDFKPLDAEEHRLIKRAVTLLTHTGAIPCTSCSYCTEGCPMNIPIPRYFSLYNADLQEIEGKAWRPQPEYYYNLTLNFGKASDCIACGQCEGACPQHLPIIEHLKSVAEYFETEE